VNTRTIFFISNILAVNQVLKGLKYDTSNDYLAKYFHSCPCCFCLCDYLQIVLYDDAFEPPQMLQEAGNLVPGMHMPTIKHIGQLYKGG
jgi:hypothetical protein